MNVHSSLMSTSARAMRASSPKRLEGRFELLSAELDSRGKTIAAARYLFATKGFHQTAMSELATEAKVSVGQIYRLFKSKDEIIEAIIRDESEGWLAELSALNDSVTAGEMTIEDAFLTLVRDALEGEDEALSFEILSEAYRNQVITESINRFCGGYRVILRDLACKANDKLSEVDAEAAEELLLSCMFGLGHRELSRPKLDIEITARKTTHMILAALRSLPG